MATGGGAAEEEMHNEYESGWIDRPRTPAQSPAMGTPSPAPPAAALGTPQREAVTFEPLVGVGQYYQGGKVPNDSPMTRDPSVRVSADESPVLSSASDLGSTPSRFVTRSDFQRVKRRLVKMSEHLRDSL